MNFFSLIDPIWFSLGPLLSLNFLILSTLIVFASIRKRKPLPIEESLRKRHHSRLVGLWLKEYFYWILTPIEKFALRLKLTPNFFTTLGFALSLSAGIAFYSGNIALGGWLVLLGGACDMLDGRIARKTRQCSASGAFYDSVMDRFGELAVLIGLAGFYRGDWMLWFVLIALFGSMMVSYTRACGQAAGVDCQEGIMQRTERIVYLGVGSALDPIFAHFLFSSLELKDLLMRVVILFIAGMTNFTALHRMIFILRKLRKNAQNLERAGLEERIKIQPLL